MGFRGIATIACALLCLAPLSSAQSRESVPEGVVRRIDFSGLQRISAATLRARIGTREGQPLDAAQIEADVRALDALGWFESIRTEAETLPLLIASLAPGDTTLPVHPLIRIVFVLEERPFLAKVEFRGSRVLRREQFQVLLARKGIALKIAAPANPTELFHARRAIEEELANLGYLRAEVRLQTVPVARASVRAIFQVHDGPRVHVSKVQFDGNSPVNGFSDVTLARQMKLVAPGALFAAARGKTTYTPARLAQDIENVARYYRNHGHPEARLGEPQVMPGVERRRRWFPWPRRVTRETLQISIPVAEGPRFALASLSLEGATPRLTAQLAPTLRLVEPGAPYSEEILARVRERIRHLAVRGMKGTPWLPEVELVPRFDRDTGLARVTYRVREVEPYTVRRIEFAGHHRFTDRYFRRRVQLDEGGPFDATKLEQGLAQLARAGYIRPVNADDVRVHLDDETRTARITIRVEEIGRQRVSLVGGGSSLGNTLGLAYNVFDWLGGEELIATHLDGGPDGLRALIGIAKEGLFGTRLSLGVNIFRNVVRPRLPGAAGRGRLFTTRNNGLSLTASYPVSSQSTLGWSYERSRDSSTLNLPGVPSTALQTQSARRAVGLTFTRDAEGSVLEASAGVSGGWLGGDERLLRSSIEYARIHTDPLTHGRNAWAWRAFLAGVAAHSGASGLPFHQRLFGGDQLVRGLRTGELAPYIVTASGDSVPQGHAGGANLVTAMNAEYRVPLETAGHKAEAAAFFDAGMGWLLPRWMGSARPQVVAGTNGLVRASTGVELRLTLPVLQQTLRLHYAVNPLRLARAFLPDGSVFRATERRSAFGWALGAFF